MQRAKSITLETLATVITFGELAYRVGKLGWDCWSLYKDISSPEEYYGAYDDYVSALDSPVITFSDTAFTPPLFPSDAVVSTLDEAVLDRYLYGYQFQNGCLYPFSTKTGLKTGSWGITERQSDYGLDLLGTIVDTQLKQADFATFNAAEALEVIKADILNEIRQGNRGCSAEDLIFYIGANFRQYFPHGHS